MPGAGGRGLEGGNILFSNYIFIKRSVRTLDISILPAINHICCFSPHDLQLCPKQGIKRLNERQRSLLEVEMSFKC